MPLIFSPHLPVSSLSLAYPFLNSLPIQVFIKTSGTHENFTKIDNEHSPLSHASSLHSPSACIFPFSPLFFLIFTTFVFIYYTNMDYFQCKKKGIRNVWIFYLMSFFFLSFLYLTIKNFNMSLFLQLFIPACISMICLLWLKIHSANLSHCLSFIAHFLSLINTFSFSWFSFLFGFFFCNFLTSGFPPYLPLLPCCS